MFVVAPQSQPQRIELLDFGIARIGDEVELTQAGVIMGTPGYMAPEVLAGAPAGIASDVYGFAASLYFALVGSSPKEANHAPASALIAGIPEGIDDILVRALDADPSRRHATASELEAELAKLELPWTGCFPIDRMTSSIPPPIDEDPTVDPEAPATQVEGQKGTSPLYTRGG